ncbi:J domain-containing protein [Reichenbachiella versicolor]|uniref:J domain-containing protein n=1 Tax=Reichenbachiella versicolor TaxID=1821036 RepID=UPI000D6E5A80|nr:DnaJ domain-containing protein [Reichenbachiella versicolor]
MVDYYELLGIPSTATQREIKLAFKEMAKRYHPDSYTGGEHTEEQFKLINQAYQVLSDPHTKAQYDLKRTYGAIYSAPSPSPFQQHYRYPFGRKPPFYRKVKVNSKENIRATLVAFLVTLGIGILVYGGTALWKYKKSLERAERMEIRQDTFKEAVAEKEKGNVAGALLVLKGMGYFSNEETYMRKFKTELLKGIEKNAKENMASGQFGVAAHQYEVLMDYTYLPSMEMMIQLAHAYHYSGNYRKAIQWYQKLRIKGLDTQKLLFELAKVYDEGVQDYEQALVYYQLSADRAVSQYEADLGKAYPLLINAGMIPKSHYEVYLKVSEMQLILGKYNEAVESIAWGKEIWSDSLAIWAIEVKAYDALGQRDKMNHSLSIAKSIDPDFTL